MYICPICYSNNIQLDDNPDEFVVGVSCLDCNHAWDLGLDDPPVPQLKREREGNNIHVTNKLGEFVLTKNDYPGQKWKLFSLEQIGVNPKNKKRSFISQFDSLDEIYRFLEQV